MEIPVTNQADQHRNLTNQFIELANKIRNEQNIDPALVSGSLMTASSIYATFVAAGNTGVLEPSGVEKVVKVYRRTLEHHQAIKKNQLKEQKKQSDAGNDAE
jgi:hypothetical protein